MPSRQYVYAVVPADHPMDVAAERGVDGGALRLEVDGPIAALVSPTAAERMRPTRAALTAHERVVGRAHEEGPVLPVRFGTLFPDRGAVSQELLRPGRAELEAMLAEVRDKDEFRIRARYLPSVALREVVARSPDVRRLRARLAARGGAAAEALKLELGETVAFGLQALREEEEAVLLERLAPLGVAWESLADRSEDAAVHTALLVERKRVRELEEAVEELAAENRERLALEVTGPLAPWDFTTVDAGAA